MEQLGEPLNVKLTARLIGVSCWTLRQKLMPMGLPHFRIGKNGKLTFYREQVIRWILQHQSQRKGGFQ